MKKIIFFGIVLSVILTSCQTVVDADELLDVEERVSIIGFLSPSDTVLRVHVSKALPSIGTPITVNQQGNFPKEFLITNAFVTLSNADGDSVQLNYDAESNAYLTDAANLSIEINENYFLKVVVDEKEFNAACSIPQKIEEINETITLRKDEFGQEIATLNMSFNDIKDNENYYVLGGWYRAVSTYDGQEPYPFESWLFFDTDEFKTDNLADGGVLNGSTEIYIGNSENITEAAAILQVANVEEVLFQHLRSSRTNEDADGNPFVEYAIAPNNILDEGAIGIFAGYSLTEKVIEIEQE